MSEINLRDATKIMDYPMMPPPPNVLEFIDDEIRAAAKGEWRGDMLIQLQLIKELRLLREAIKRKVE